MFKEGDEVICIIPSKSLEKGKKYTVDWIAINTKTKLRYYIKLIGLKGAFRNDRFLTPKQTERLLKIKKLLNEY